MTETELRDYFAGQTLAGLCANPKWTEAICQMSTKPADWYARASYEIADAMMAERKKERK